MGFSEFRWARERPRDRFLAHYFPIMPGDNDRETEPTTPPPFASYIDGPRRAILRESFRFSVYIIYIYILYGQRGIHGAWDPLYIYTGASNAALCNGSSSANDLQFASTKLTYIASISRYKHCQIIRSERSIRGETYNETPFASNTTNTHTRRCIYKYTQKKRHFLGGI